MVKQLWTMKPEMINILKLQNGIISTVNDADPHPALIPVYFCFLNRIIPDFPGLCGIRVSPIIPHCRSLSTSRPVGAVVWLRHWCTSAFPYH